MKTLRERVDALPKHRQSKILHAGRSATSRAFCLEDITIECIVSGISEELEKQEAEHRKAKRRHNKPKWLIAKLVREKKLRKK